jgi:DNA-binding CsgD family transcriptional regulator
MSQLPVPCPGDTDEDALRGAVGRLQRTAKTSVAFGGRVQHGALRLSQFAGTRTSLLRGLAVRPDTGAGGRSWTRSQVMVVDDYRNSASITHDYDGPVLAEGIRSVVAAPVVVTGQTRGILYAAVREPTSLGSRVQGVVAAQAQALARELEVRDEVDRRVELLSGRRTQTGGDSDVLERVRHAHAELRELTATVGDPGLRDRLGQIGAMLNGDAKSAGPQRPLLSPRELDVLCLVALGCSYSEVARRLFLLPQTVKSYMRNVLVKLDVHGRHEAVVAARRLALIP